MRPREPLKLLRDILNLITRSIALFFVQFFDVGFLKRKLIPVEPFKECKGIAIVTLGRVGKRWISGNLGSGLVLRKLGPGSWSAPSALRVVGVGSGVQIGLEITDYVVFLNSDEAVQLFYQAQV